MKIARTIFYFVLGVVPATLWGVATLPYSLYSAFTYPGLLPIFGASGLWLATLEHGRVGRLRSIITIILLLAGIVAMSPYAVSMVIGLFMILEIDPTYFLNNSGGLSPISSIVAYLSMITPILVATHYIFYAAKDYASNKRLQSDAAPPRA